MDGVAGLLKIRVERGINLAVRDTFSSDPYVVTTMGDQKLKTRVVKNSCNPVWNDELTLSIKHLHLPIKLTVFDKDTLTKDDKMGEAEIDIKPYMQCLRMGLKNLPDDTKIQIVQPGEHNCLADESAIVWNKGKITQNMMLRLKNVECGEVELQIEWIDVVGQY